jgi:carbonic anhydrase/acetyltransferase-like protein (isoleucine patch superfamily)
VTASNGVLLGISSSRPDLSARPLGSVTDKIVMPSSSNSASARRIVPVVAPEGNSEPATTPLGSRAPAARQVNEPSGRALVISMSIRRDMVHHGIRRQVGSARWHYRGDVPIYALGELEPTIHPDAFVHPDAVIIGQVTIGAQSSIWPGAVLRGDEGYISIGARTSIQDNCVLHTTLEHPTIVGDDCVVGHIVHLEGCTIESGVLVGNGSIVLHRVVVHSGAIVAANAVVLNDTVVPSGAVAAGVPAVIKPGRARVADIESGVANYLRRTTLYRESMRRIG